MRYVVVDVLRDLNPTSTFPNNHYDNFSMYYKLNYGEKIMDLTQPLLEVKAISQKLNCLLPRSQAKRMKKEKFNEEYMIPELCILSSFPAAYMLKLTLLPSTFHRINYLLLGEELRQNIFKKTKLGVPEYKDINWSPLCSKINGGGNIKKKLVKMFEPLVVSDCKVESEKVEESYKDLDIVRNLRCSSTDIQAYINGVTSPKMKVSGRNASKGPKSLIRLEEIDEEFPVVNVNIIPTGPQLCDLLEVLTSKSSNDIVNYEQLETLGDSFLKFAVSLALYLKFPNADEGKLTQIKGKMIGNRNLFYCGRNINLGGMLKITPFCEEHLDIPGFTVMDTIKTILREDLLSSAVLHDLKVSKEERESGIAANMDSLLTFLRDAVNTKKAYDDVTMRAIGMQKVSDKTVADTVEALIGVYIKFCGLEAGFHLISWLGILPKELGNVKSLLYMPVPSPLFVNSNVKVNDYLVSPHLLEETLGYSFKDRSFLLQAVSHPSVSHNLTDCYQRFEFLGDSILDFLLTAYICKKFRTLSPGDITDLRSALVNNVTFACLTVRYGFHKYLLMNSYALNQAICRFVQQQEQKCHTIGSEVTCLISDNEVQVAEMIDVPKVLGDLFESLAGAVFLDSGKNINTVWNVFYRLMYREINKFSENIPKNPVRLMYETFSIPKPKFGPVSVLDDLRILIPLEVIHENRQKLFHGLGENKLLAKVAAAKLALKYFT